MEPVKEAISVCSWINKKTADSVHDAWFTYNAPSSIHEIIIAGKISGWAYMNRDHIQNSQAVPSNEWHHVCITWGQGQKEIAACTESRFFPLFATNFMYSLMYSLLKIAVSRILAKIIAKSFCPCMGA